MPEFPVNEFLQQQDQALANKIQIYKPQSNTVSAIGHQCERYLVYKRTRGEDAAPYSTNVQALFDEGKVQEQEAIRLITSLGWHYERSQEWMEFKDLQIRGKMEGVLLRPDNGRVKWAAEIKKASEYAFDKLNTWQDLTMGSTWHYRWLVQLQIAIFHVASREGFDDTGVLLLKHEGKALIKPISVPLNMDIVNGAFEKAKRINAHMAAGTLSDRVEWSAGLCRTPYGSQCDFFHICNPEECLKHGQRFTDPEFIAKLDRREKVHEFSKEYSKLDKEVKAILKGLPNVVAGPFKITGGKNRGGSWITSIERVMSNQDAATIKPLTQAPAAPAAPEPQKPTLTEKFLTAILAAQSLKDMDLIKADAKRYRDRGELIGSAKDKVAHAFAFKKKNLLAKEKGVKA